MNIWNDIEAQYFSLKKDKKKMIFTWGKTFFLSKLLFEKCSILDIGCAQGGFYKILKSFLKSFSYTGIDNNSEKMIIKAKKIPKSQFSFC